MVFWYYPLQIYKKWHLGVKKRGLVGDFGVFLVVLLFGWGKMGVEKSGSTVLGGAC